MKQLIFIPLIIVVLGFSSIQGAVWEAIPELPQSQSYSLAWCIDQAAPGDTILLLPGRHWGPISLSGQLLLRCDVPGDAAIAAHMEPLSINDYTGKLENVTILSYLTRGPEWLVNITDSDVEMDSVSFCSGTLAGTALTVIGDCDITLSSCDLSYCPRHDIIRLVDCPNDVLTIDCQWPSESKSGLEILIWDEDDDPALGNVIY